jgi:hypothetical protein
MAGTAQVRLCPPYNFTSHNNLVQFLPGMLRRQHRHADRHRGHQHGNAEERQRERSGILPTIVTFSARPYVASGELDLSSR